MVLWVCLFAIALLLYPVSGIGFRHGLANLLGSYDMARETYIKNAGQHWYRLQMEATDNRTLERVQCECRVVGGRCLAQRADRAPGRPTPGDWGESRRP